MLEVQNLSVTGKGGVSLLERISFSLECGSCVGLTGASGAGKTTLIKAIMGVLDKTCSITEGQVALDKKNLAELTPAKRRDLCGTVIGFVPQNPMTAFDNHTRIGAQMVETFQIRLGMSKQQAKALAEETLRKVNLTDTRRMMSAYASQLSGGMLQRVTMAMLWGLRPRYILADEPTSALDEENRNLLIRLLQNYHEKVGILFLSHDPDALKMLCDEVMVLEKGKLIEKAETAQLFSAPACEWTKRFVSYAKQGEGGKWAWEAF